MWQARCLGERNKEIALKLGLQMFQNSPHTGSSCRRWLLLQLPAGPLQGKGYSMKYSMVFLYRRLNPQRLQALVTKYIIIIIIIIIVVVVVVIVINTTTTVVVIIIMSSSKTALIVP
jgi:hypothetical protein